jgi:lipoprotein NlpI
VAYYYRGNAYRKKGDSERAIQDYDAAIRLDRNYASAYNNRGVAHGNRGDLDRAIADYDLAIGLDPSNAVYLINRGLAHSGKGDWDRAIQDYDEALRLNPHQADAFLERGFAYMMQGQYDQAIGDFDTAVGLDVKDGAKVFSRGRIRFYLGQFTAAQPDLAKAVELSRNNPFNPLWLYLARVRSGHEPEEARKELADHAKRLNLPGWPAPLYAVYLGNATPTAVLAAAADGDAKRHREQLCQAYLYLGQYAVIREDLQGALRLFKSAAATCSPTTGDYASARVELQRLSR